MGLAPGSPAPDFAVQGLASAKAAPLEYATGAPTVLLFFLSSCPHCKQLIPHWNKAYEKRGAGVKVVGVMLDREPPGFFQMVSIAFPVVHAVDPRGVGRSFRISQVPMTVRVDARRAIEAVEVGEVKDERLAEIFAK
jgi:thiol-disulfide isomerase/thioredoxin